MATQTFSGPDFGNAGRETSQTVLTASGVSLAPNLGYRRKYMGGVYITPPFNVGPIGASIDGVGATSDVDASGLLQFAFQESPAGVIHNEWLVKDRQVLDTFDDSQLDVLWTPVDSGTVQGTQGPNGDPATHLVLDAGYYRFRYTGGFYEYYVGSPPQYGMAVDFIDSNFPYMGFFDNANDYHLIILSDGTDVYIYTPDADCSNNAGTQTFTVDVNLGIYFWDDFEGGTLTNWTGSVSPSVISNPYGSGLVCELNADGETIRHALPVAFDSLQYEFKIARNDAGGSGNSSYVQLFDETDSFMVEVGMRNDPGTGGVPKWSFQGAGIPDAFYGSWSAGTFYEVSLRNFDFTGDSYDVYINGAFLAQINLPAIPTGSKDIRFGNNGGGITYVDDVLIAEA